VVGDIILLETGSRIPADCILIESQDFSVDETYYRQSNQKATPKKVASNDNFDQCPDPFLLSSTLVATGVGKAVVCCVGENSRRGLKEDKLDTSSKTPL
jgi:Ca2+-transporting ATPase